MTMPQPCRRAYLLAAIQSSTGPWSALRAAALYAASPWGCHRNTARKDLRALAQHGALTPHDEDGRRTYTLNIRKAAAVSDYDDMDIIDVYSPSELYEMDRDDEFRLDDEDDARNTAAIEAEERGEAR